MSSRKLSRATPKGLSTQTHLKAIGANLICWKAKSMATLHWDFSKLRTLSRRIKMLRSTDKFLTTWLRVLYRELLSAIMWGLATAIYPLKHHLASTANTLLSRIKLWKVKLISYLDMAVVNQASWPRSQKTSLSIKTTQQQVWKWLEIANSLSKSSQVWLITANNWPSLTQNSKLNYRIGCNSHMIITVSTIKTRLKLKISTCEARTAART